MRISPRLTVVLLAALVAAPACAATPALAELTLQRFAVGASEENGTPDVQAGSHPFALTTSFILNGVGPSTGYLRDIKLELPPGFVGDPTATPRCGYQEFIKQSCGFETQVGVASTYIVEGQQAGAGEARPTTGPVYNLVPSGVAAEFGFLGAGKVPVLLRASVRSGGDYGLTLSVPYVSQAALVVAGKVTIWGVPAASAHDELRCGIVSDLTHGPRALEAPGSGLREAGREDEIEGPVGPFGSGAIIEPTSECEASGGRASQAAPLPLLTNPTSCATSRTATLSIDSWGEPGVFHARSASMPGLSGCEKLDFSPAVTVAPDRGEGSTPTGLDVDVHVPQEGGEHPQLASSNVKDITIALPAGVALNPAGADGLEACSGSQIGFEGFQELDGETEPGARTAIFSPTLPEPLEQGVNFCPDAAKIGTVKISTPILANSLEGAVYLATQNANPFGSLVAAYVVAEEPKSGVLVKLPGALTLNPSTGQITATFANAPQLPFEDIDLDFFGSERALLATPARCGSYTMTASLQPWSGNPPANVSSAFEITSGVGGSTSGVSGSGSSGCPSSSLPFDPSLTGGVTNPNAGAFSPLTVTVSRADGQQSLQAFALRLPAGVSGMLSGVPLCAEAQANAGTCPETSRIGETTVAAGLGADPYILTGGKVYLTEGYEGAPFGLAIVTPVKAGPLDLEDAPENHPPCDCLVIRAKVEVDPSSAQLTIATGLIPNIIDGIPLQIQHLNITIDRPGFIVNSTDCNPLQVTGTVTGGEGASASVSSPFQVGECRSLAFTPKLTAVTRANGELAGHGASLHLAIASPTAQANLRSLKLDLPQRLPARLETIQRACPESTFDANPAACPKGSLVGSASVQTPILSTTMTGPAYLVSKNGSGISHPGESTTEKEEAAFPDLVLVLQGEGVRIDLTGALFVSAKNITSVAFRTIPDVPIRRLDLVLPEGKSSILAASSGLCTKRPLTMFTAITGQDGARLKPSVKVGVEGCKKPRKHKHHAKKHHKQ
jgi:hypothetical protein